VDGELIAGLVDDAGAEDELVRLGDEQPRRLRAVGVRREEDGAPAPERAVREAKSFAPTTWRSPSRSGGSRRSGPSASKLPPR
jgi:hypothetical protein